MATTQQRDYLSEQLFSSIGKNAARLQNQAITGFLSMKGNLYDRKLMVVGRAVNGCQDGITPNELALAASSSDYATIIFDSVVDKNGVCPMSWVTNCWANPSNLSSNYNTKKS